MKRSSIVIVLLLLAILISVIPLMMISDSEFEGADGEAEEMISEINPDYEPWAENLLEPPGGETESLLFALQAALGTLVIGYGFGYLVARKRFRAEESIS